MAEQIINNGSYQGDPSAESVYQSLQKVKENFSENYADIAQLQIEVQASVSGFQGSLAIADTPVNDGYYFASEDGTYINAGNLVVTLTNMLSIIVVGNTQTTFELIEIPASLVASGLIELGETQAVSGNAVYNEVDPLNSALFNKIPSGTNSILELVGSNVDDTNLWETGFLTSSGAVFVSSGWIHTKKYYSLHDVNYDFKIGIYGNGAICFYDENKQFISSLLKGDTDTNTYYVVNNTTIPLGAKYIRISHYTTTYSTSEIYVKTSEVLKVAKSDTFVKTDDLEDKVNTHLEKYEVIADPPDTEYLTELINSDVNDTNLWAAGFYTSSGNIFNSSGWYHTVKKYYLKKGEYTIKVNINGNAKALILNLDGSVRKVLSAISGYSQTFTEVIDKEALFVTSQNAYASGRPTTERISIVNNTIAYPKIITTEAAKYAGLDPLAKIIEIYRDTYRPKVKRPMVTIISDDGKTGNLEWFKPILDEFGVKATFAIVGKWTRDVDLGLASNVISSEGLRDLFNEGHDIASHTWTHTADWGTVLTYQEIEEEMSRTKVFLEKITDTPVNMFVSPYGIRNPEIDNIISKYYDANFISGYGSLNPIPLNNYFINRVSFDGSESTYELKWLTDLKPAIDEAIANNNWLIFAIHPQYTQYQSGNPDYLDRREELRTLLQYCQDNNVEVTTAKKGYEYFKNFVNIGVRGYDSKVYQLGMDGSEYNENYFLE